MKKVFVNFLFVLISLLLAERSVVIKDNSNLQSASFDQDTSCEDSQKTNRSVQHENYPKGRYSQRNKRRKRNKSHKIEIESLFNVKSNLSLGINHSAKFIMKSYPLDDAYEKLNRLTNRNSKAREALLKIQESVVEIDAEVKLFL